ncbi:MAG: class I SAM-dependent methyltransferase [Magnetococcales bacterium]|nr:class I SAM-dependent methyltransferase [Magnetococcales bacterium]
MDQKTHWEGVYGKKKVTETSWYQKIPLTSLTLIENAALHEDEAIIDVGGGASTLVDHLLTAGYQNLTVLDISSKALENARLRLLDREGEVAWIDADVTDFDSQATYDLWHDRAVFHFFTQPEQRRAYVASLMRHLKPRGHAIIATFAIDGPTRCSNLEIVRYTPEALHQELGPQFELLETITETHITPSNKKQSFVYCRFRRRPGEP